MERNKLGKNGHENSRKKLDNLGKTTFALRPNSLCSKYVLTIRTTKFSFLVHVRFWKYSHLLLGNSIGVYRIITFDSPLTQLTK